MVELKRKLVLDVFFIFFISRTTRDLLLKDHITNLHVDCE